MSVNAALLLTLQRKFLPLQPQFTSVLNTLSRLYQHPFMDIAC